MLIIVFGFLLALTLVFLLTGQYMDAPFLKISGSVFMFVLGLIVLFGSLQVQTGSLKTYIYGDNFTGYHWDYDYVENPNPNVDVGVYIFHVNESYTYSDINPTIVNDLDVMQLFGFLMCVIGVFLFMFAFLEIKKPREID